MNQFVVRARRFGVALLFGVGCLPLWNLSVAAQAEQMPIVIEETWKQNDGLLVPEKNFTQAMPKVTEETPRIRGASSLPSAYSLRDVNGISYVTSVKDQGSTGLCWAYAALGACESNILLQGLEIPDAWRDSNGELTFSVGALGWYPYTAHYQIGDLTSGDYVSMAKKGISGGNPAIAGYALAAGIGTQLEQYAPMSDWNEGYSEYQRYNSYYRMQSSDILMDVDDDGIAVIKQWLYESGAVSISYYSKGTYYDNGESVAYYQTNKTADNADHAVLLVGWDDNYSRTNFQSGKQPASDGAFLVRNSWGSDDADGGYFWISYEEPSLCEAARFQMTEAAEHTAYYQYDGSVSYANVNFTSAANVFTAESDGTLTEVMFPMASTNPQTGQYTISVYRLSEDAASPTGGELLCKKSGWVSYCGYKSISLEDEAISLHKGDRFSVVLSLAQVNMPDKTLYLAFESNADSVLERHCAVQSGQTFVELHEDNWMDITQLREWTSRSGKQPYANLGNAAIKAIVEPTDTAVNRTQLEKALSYGAPRADSNALYQAAYAEATSLGEDATQAEVDNAAQNLLAGLEREGVLQYASESFVKEQSAADYLCGDVDQDGDVDSDDVFALLYACALNGANYSTNLTRTQAAAADCDGDGKIESDDLYDLLAYCAYFGAGVPREWSAIISNTG